jgi:hypothetical protein
MSDNTDWTRQIKWTFVGALFMRIAFAYVSTSILGLSLGMAAYIPWTWIEWKSSGSDSGPPTESYLSFLRRWDFDPLTLVFLPAGLVTASLYWRLSAIDRAKKR